MSGSLVASLTTVAAIAGATVAVCLGQIDAQSYVAIVAGALGLGAGAGIHAAGVNQKGSGGGS